MKERPNPFQLLRGNEVEAVWNPQEPRTPLEFAWLRLPTLVRDYFEVGYIIGDPKLTKDERTELLNKRRDMLGNILRDPNLSTPFLDFLILRDRPKKK